MVNELWINLPVKDVKRSREFFSRLGFTLGRHGNTDEAAPLQLGKNKTTVMLFSEPMFTRCCGGELPDRNRGSEVLISLGVESRDQVDQMATRWSQEGGRVFGQPASIDGWMYGCGLVDLDGHKWNLLYMDTSRMPQPT